MSPASLTKSTLPKRHHREKATDLPTVMSSPMKMESNTAVNTNANGLNIGGYAGPRLATAHEFRLYLPAVESAPCTTIGISRDGMAATCKPLKPGSLLCLLVISVF